MAGRGRSGRASKIHDPSCRASDRDHVTCARASFEGLALLRTYAKVYQCPSAATESISDREAPRATRGLVRRRAETVDPTEWRSHSSGGDPRTADLRPEGID